MEGNTSSEDTWTQTSSDESLIEPDWTPNPLSGWHLMKNHIYKPLYFGFNSIGTKGGNQLKVNDEEESDYVLGYIIVSEDTRGAKFSITDQGPNGGKIVIWKTRSGPLVTNPGDEVILENGDMIIYHASTWQMVNV